MAKFRAEGDGVRIPARDISLLKKKKSWLWDPFNLLLSGYWGSLLGKKREGCEADDSLPPSADVENEWGYISTPCIRLHGVDSDNFIFLFTKPSDTHITASIGRKVKFILATLYEGPTGK